MEFNAPQREAIHYLDHPLLVLAGAGSGKTRVITQKMAWLIEENIYAPRQIAAITFTNKAAHEMRERIAKQIGARAKAIHISTFHALGVRILREEAAALGYKPRFSILDATDSLGILSEIANTTSKGLVKEIQTAISNWKNNLLAPHEVQPEGETQHLAARIFPAYENALKAYQAVDFDDLILLPVHLFRRHDDILQRWQRRLRYWLIDEYQDTNACQYQLLRLLVGNNARFTAVGDDDQAIYGWRGADIANLLRLPHDYPQLKVIKLEQNYRSTARILHAANQVITHNKIGDNPLFGKKLWSALGEGEPITVRCYAHQDDEADGVVSQLQLHKHQHGGSWANYAILYRSNHLARLFETALRARGIRYRLSGGQSFFDKSEIKDVLAYLRLIANADDDPAFIRAATTPRRGIGTATLQELGQHAGQHKKSLFAAALELSHLDNETIGKPGNNALSTANPIIAVSTALATQENSATDFVLTAPGEKPPLTAQATLALRNFCQLIRGFARRGEQESTEHGVLLDLLTAIGYQQFLYDNEDERTAAARWSNVNDFAAWVAQKGKQDGRTLNDIAQTLALINKLEQQDEQDSDEVQLSTLHAAKGLEYKNVFLIGCEEGLLPHRESLDDEARLAEERRLMYVGITRAKNNLFISYCERRKQAREILACEPSRFIAEMGDGLSRPPRHSAPLNRNDSREKIAALRALLEKK